MKNKMKEKASVPSDSSSEGVGVDEFKKEAALCDNDTTGKAVDKKERLFLDPKVENEQGDEDLKDDVDAIDAKMKQENVIIDPPVLYPPDGNDNLMMAVPVVDGTGSSVPVIPTNMTGGGVQPLPSNVINKQAGTMEAQYMQQQSQIFVFSTSLANKAAESVLQGHFATIIAYHCAQPGTKKYLEKHPLKLNQFNRHSPAQWLNNLAQMKQKPGFGGAPTGPPPPPGVGGKNAPPRGLSELSSGGGGGPTAPRMMNPGGDMDSMDSESPDGPQGAQEVHPDFPPINVWNQQGNANQNSISSSGPMRPIDRDKNCALRQPPSLVEANFPGISHFTLTGTKVPTENLTPQQRQHREEQLATLRKMQQMLFPENQAQSGDEFNNPRVMNNPNQQDASAPNGNANGRGGRNSMEVPMGSPMVNTPNAVGDPPIINASNNAAMNAESIESMPPSSPSPMQKMMGNNAAAQLEWHKLQHQFYEDRKKKGRTESPIPRGGNLAKMSSMNNMIPQSGNMPPQGQVSLSSMQGGSAHSTPNAASCMQGPPPPYHQTVRSASVPIAIPSPNPGSPSNTTSNLSLPSPRTSSDINSPAEMSKLVKMTTCSPPTNHGSPACSKMTASNPDTPASCASASQSPTSNKEMFSRNMSGMSQKNIKSGSNNCSIKEPNLMPVPSPQQIQYLNTFEGQELIIQKQPNTSLKEPNSSSPLGHGQMSDEQKCKTPTTSSNSPTQPPGPDLSPRYQQLQQSNNPIGQPNQLNPMTPHSTGPSAKDGGPCAVPSSPDNVPQTGPGPCRSENIPLNPNGVPCQASSKAALFDPITSLAQMSQQLTSQAPPTACQGSPYPPNSLIPMESLHGDGMDNSPFGPQQGPGMLDLPPGFMGNPSPKPTMMNQGNRCIAPPFFGGGQFPRMMGPNTFNGMNVQVKASTPNTIQYMPARPSGGSPNPGIRNPPSLDFLQRFANPPGQDGKPNMFMGCHPGMDPGNAGMMLGGAMMGPGPGGNMYRGQLRPPGMKPGPMGKSSAPFDPMSMNNAGMYKGPGPPGPLGMPPDASQPLPPSMSQGQNFKNSPFVGPTVADPNYAQQFHNFQQQLYATNTRNQLNSHLGQQPYFIPK